MKRRIDRDRPLWPETVVGGKYVLSLEKLLQALRPPDAHGNRVLHADDVLHAHTQLGVLPVVRENCERCACHHGHGVELVGVLVGSVER